MSCKNTSQKYWNQILAKEGLSVWKGTDHHLVYLNRPPDHDQHNCGSRSGGSGPDDDNKRPIRRYMKLGGAGDSQTSMFLELALTALSKRDQTFLKHYQTETVHEIALAYNIAHAAVYNRMSRLRKKLQSIALKLKQYR
jgi:hypothetical protein